MSQRSVWKMPHSETDVYWHESLCALRYKSTKQMWTSLLLFCNNTNALMLRGPRSCPITPEFAITEPLFDLAERLVVPPPARSCSLIVIPGAIEQERGPCGISASVSGLARPSLSPTVRGYSYMNMNTTISDQNIWIHRCMKVLNEYSNCVAKREGNTVSTQTLTTAMQIQVEVSWTKISLKCSMFPPC